MSDSFYRRVGPAAVVALAMLFFSTPSAAQSVSISLVGSVSGCSDSDLNGNFNVTSSGSVSGGDTIFVVSVNSQSFNVPVPTAELEELVQALSATGGSHVSTFESSPDENGCVVQGTLTISVGGSGTISANATGSAVTTNAVLGSSTKKIFAALSGRIREALGGSANGVRMGNNAYSIHGMAAGDGTRPPIGAWAGYSFTDSSNDFSSIAYSSDQHTVTIGLDTMLSDGMLLGVAVSLERSEVKTQFNRGEQDITAINLTPYAGFLLTDWLTVDMSVGIGSVSNKQFRTSGGTQITSDLKSTRIYGNVNATATWAFDRILASGRTGLLYATQDDEDFRESNGTLIGDSRSKLGRFLFGGELAYSAGAWEPYVSGTFEYDFARTKQNFAAGVAAPRRDDSDVLVAVGLRYFGDNNVSASAEYSTVIGRRNLDEDSFSLSARWQF